MDPSTTAAEFERHRGHLVAVAYRMLGTLADAEDAVQETYLRFARTDTSACGTPAPWLTTTIARICLDQLGSARARRETYVGPWLPEPAVGAGSPAAFAAAPLGPEDRVTLDESVSMAMLVLLESLSPAERTAFVLHEVLGLPYDEIARRRGPQRGGMPPARHQGAHPRPGPCPALYRRSRPARRRRHCVPARLFPRFGRRTGAGARPGRRAALRWRWQRSRRRTAPGHRRGEGRKIAARGRRQASRHRQQRPRQRLIGPGFRRPAAGSSGSWASPSPTT